MALIDLKTDLSKLKRDSFTSDIENKSKGIASGLNLDFAKFQPIEDKFKEGVSEPNRNFGKLVNQPTPTVPTSVPGTPEKLIQLPRSFDATLDKPTPTVPTSFSSFPLARTQVPTGPTTMEEIPPILIPPVIDSNWTVFQNIIDKKSKYSTLGIANWFPDTHAIGFTLRAENFDTFYKGPSSVYGKLGFVNYFDDIHATGFTGHRLFGDPRFPEGSEYIGIGSYNNPGRLWFGTTPKGQLHPYWSHGQSAIDYKSSDWTRKPFPIFSAPPGISSNNPNPQYDTRDKLYGATEAYTNDRGSYYLYFKRNVSELNIGRRGTLASAWDHGSVKLSIDDTNVPTIGINQYTKFSKTRLFNDSFTSFPNAEGQKTPIPVKLNSFPPWTSTIPRGGPVLAVTRGLQDIERHAKWIITGQGIVWGLTQIGLQLLNTRPETRIWNPLSLASIIPTFHIPRHFQLINFRINAQRFGVSDTKLGGSTYIDAEDYIGDNSRLIQFLDTYVNTGGTSIASTKVLGKEIPSEQGLKELAFGGKKRQTPGQAIYLIPGRGGIFGAIPGAEVRSQYHKSGEPIYQSPLEPQIPHAHLGRYKTLAYGRLEALAESDQRRGTSNQFKWEGGIESEPWYPIGKRKDSEYGKYGFKKGKDGVAEVVEVEAKKDLRLEKRYKLGDPGKPGLERLRHIHGVNAESGDKLDTIDLLNAQGYISQGNLKGGSTTADGRELPFTESKPTLKEYPDLIPLHFYDVNNKAWILFRAYIGKFNDTISPSWGSTEIAGRPVPHYYYQKTERKISFDFKVAAMSKHELAPMWQKLNYLVGLCYPSFTGSTYPTMINPFIKLTLGDVFHHVPGFLTTLTVSPIDNISWELIRDNERGLARVPMGVTVSTDFTYVGDNMPSQISSNHYLQAPNEQSWVDYKSTFWGTPALGISYPAALKKKDTGNR